MRIWALLGARRGDNDQVIALADALGLPYETKHLRYNRLRHLGPRLLGATFHSLTPESRALILDGEPDATISTGHRSVPVVQELRRRSQGRIRSIHVNYPRISPGHFDLVVATPEYPIAEHKKLLRIPLALTRATGADADDANWLSYPEPRRLLVLGGPTLYWKLDAATVLPAIEDLLAAVQREGGSFLIVGSPRTPARLLAEVGRRIAGTPAVLVPTGGPPSYASLLRHADTIAVTADSVLMVSEAIATGKPVGLVPIQPSMFGRIVMGLWGMLRPGQRLRPRDLREFWRTIEERKLVGSVRRPCNGDVPDLNAVVAARGKAALNIDDS